MVMTNDASHNLLSSSSPPLGFTQLTVTWGGKTCVWRAVNRDGSTGAIVYDTGHQIGAFPGDGVPAKLRLDTGAYNHTARYFGTTDILVLNTDVTCPDPVQLAGAAIEGERFTFQFTGTPGHRYVVEFTSSPSVHTSWQVLTEIPSLSESPFRVSDVLTDNNRFYRVRFLP
jgi:hypothetical protein